MYHAFTYARAMGSLLKEAADTVRTADASQAAHVQSRASRLQAALEGAARHAHDFGASPALDNLLQSELKTGVISSESIEAIDAFVSAAHRLERELALGKPTTALLSAEHRLPQEVFDIFQEPYLAAADYVEYFAVDVEDLREWLRPRD